MLKLITAGPSPYARKVAIALLEKAIAFEPVDDLPWAEAVETRRYSPLEQLPILVPPGEPPVFDSSLILQWLELRYPRPPLLPVDVDARIAALRLQTFGERLMEIAQALIFETHRPLPSDAVIDRLTRKIEHGLRAVDAELVEAPGPDQPINLGHIALGTTLAVWEFIVADGMCQPIEALRWRGSHQRLTELMTQLEERPTFVQTAPRSMKVDITAEVA